MGWGEGGGDNKKTISRSGGNRSKIVVSGGLYEAKQICDEMVRHPTLSFPSKARSGRR